LHPTGVPPWRGKTWAFRAVMGLGVAALVAAGCSSSRGSSSSSSSSSSTATSAAPGGQAFGSLASPCGPGSATGATDTGVTGTTINIGYGDDAGFSGSPGLDKEMSDAVKGFVKWCNDQGGILGRKVVGDYYDAAIVQTNNVMQQACKTDFTLVGEGWALDEIAEQTRLGCNLVAVPGFAVGPDFANGPEMYQGVPNPDDLQPGSDLYQAAKLFPAQVKKADILHTTLPATESSSAKVKEEGTQAGFTWLDCGVKINYTGEPNSAPFAQKFQSCGAQLIFSNLGTGPPLYNMLEAFNQLNYHPTLLMEANDYTPEFAAWNTQGLGNNVYVREAFQPIENADVVPAVKQFVDIVKATGGQADQLGEQSASSFLLWATAAKSCGSNLTRQCLVNYLSKVHSWTGGGLHAADDPGSNTPPSCGMLIKLTGTSWSQFYPQKRGTLDCNPKYLQKISSANWGTTLNADRIATKFLGGKLITPQS
jgi:ABC-type branched-subunit amino acid transport system substrate-binding protein